MQPQALAYFEFTPNAARRQIYLRSSGKRICRFCKQDTTTTRFSNDAHAVPEALGNHELQSREECDRCNKSGSEFESDLAAHLAVSRAMSRVRGKEGDVKHRYGQRPSSIESDSKNNRVLINRELGDDSLRTLRTPTGIRYLVKVPGHRPLNVVKALARMAYMLAPAHELSNLEHIRLWLRGETTWERPSYDHGFIPGPGLSMVRVLLDKQPSPAIGQPHYSLSFSYGCDVMTLHIPGPGFAQTNLPMPGPIRSPYPPHEVKIDRITVLNDQVWRGRIDSVDVFVPALAALPTLSHDEIADAAYHHWLQRGAPFSSNEERIADWLDGEQDLLWAQVDAALPSGIASR